MRRDKSPLWLITSGVSRDSRDGKFPGIPGFFGHFPEFPGKRGRESRDFPGNPGKIGIFRIPVSREFTDPGKLTPLLITYLLPYSATLRKFVGKIFIFSKVSGQR